MDMLKYKYHNINLEYTKLRPRFPNYLWRKLTGKPTQVLFLHGFNEPFSKHESLLRKVAYHGYQVLAINMPGHGSSEKLPEIGWEVLVDIVIKFCQEQKLQNLIILGYSMGGGIALKILESGRMIIKRLSLISPFCYSQTTESLKAAVGYLQEAVNVVENAQKTARTIPLVNPVSTAYTVSAYVNIFLSFKLNLTSNSTPIKVILNELDPVIRLNSAQQALHAIPNLTIFTLPDVSHDIYFLDEEQENAIITKLFD